MTKQLHKTYELIQKFVITYCIVFPCVCDGKLGLIRQFYISIELYEYHNLLKNVVLEYELYVHN